MKILFFIDGLRLGGKQRRLIELLKGLKKHSEFEIVVVSVRKEISYKDFYQLHLPIIFIEKKRKFDPSIFYKFYNITKKYKPEIVHTWSSMNTAYAFFAKMLSKFVLINSQITDAPHKINWVSRFGVQTKLNFIFSDLILANSKAGLLSYNAPINKSRYIHNGYDFKRLQDLKNPEVIKEKFNIRTKYAVSMVGDFAERKDYPTYIKAAEKTTEIRNDVTFLAIGGGKYFKRFKQKVKDNDRIIFTGKQSDVESIINVMDICVLMTNNEVHGEGISNAIMEYMAMNKPVIASAGGGTDEIVKHNHSGFLIKPKSSRELCERIIFLLDNQKIAVEMGKAGRKVIEEEFSLKKMISSFERLYKYYYT